MAPQRAQGATDRGAWCDGPLGCSARLTASVLAVTECNGPETAGAGAAGCGRDASSRLPRRESSAASLTQQRSVLAEAVVDARGGVADAVAQQALLDGPHQVLLGEDATGDVHMDDDIRPS